MKSVLLFTLFLLATPSLTYARSCSTLLQQVNGDTNTKQNTNFVENVIRIVGSVPQIVAFCSQQGEYHQLFTYFPIECSNNLIAAFRSGLRILSKSGNWFQLSKQKISLGLSLAAIMRSCPFAQNIDIAQLISIKNCISAIKNQIQIPKFERSQFTKQNVLSQLIKLRNLIIEILQRCDTGLAKTTQKYMTDSCMDATLDIIFNLKQEQPDKQNAKILRNSLLLAYKNCKK